MHEVSFELILYMYYEIVLKVCDFGEMDEIAGNIDSRLLILLAHRQHLYFR